MRSSNIKCEVMRWGDGEECGAPIWNSMIRGALPDLTSAYTSSTSLRLVVIEVKPYCRTTQEALSLQAIERA